MLCDCAYAKKNCGMDQGMQLASQVENLTLDHMTPIVLGTEKLALGDMRGAKQGPSMKQYNYENCRCFKIKHIDDLCKLCVQSCRWRAKEAYWDRKEEEREKRRGMREEIFVERLARVSEEQRDIVAKWMREEMEHSTA